MEMFLEERPCGATGGSITSAYQRLLPESAYQRKAEQLMADENCFKIYVVRLIFISGLFLKLSTGTWMT